MYRYYKFTSILFALFFILSLSSCSTVDKVKPFKFSIIKTEDGVKLKGIKGTAWKNLSFTLADNQTQAVNEMGMTELGNKNDESSHEKLADFLLTITKKDNSILMVGVKGCDWTELSYTNNNYQEQFIDESGVGQ